MHAPLKDRDGADGAAHRRAAVVELSLPQVGPRDPLPRPRQPTAAQMRLPPERGSPPASTRSPARTGRSRRDTALSPGTPGVAPIAAYRGMTPVLAQLSQQWLDRGDVLSGLHGVAQAAGGDAHGRLDADLHRDGWNEDGFTTRVLRCPQDKSTQACGITAVQVRDSRIVTLAPDALRIWELFLDDSSSSGLLFDLPPVCRPELLGPPRRARGASCCVQPLTP